MVGDRVSFQSTHRVRTQEKLTINHKCRRKNVNKKVQQESAHLYLVSLPNKGRKETIHQLEENVDANIKEPIELCQRIICLASHTPTQIIKGLREKNYDIALDLAEVLNVIERLKKEIRWNDLIAKSYKKENVQLQDKIIAKQEALNTSRSFFLGCCRRAWEAMKDEVEPKK